MRETGEKDLNSFLCNEKQWYQRILYETGKNIWTVSYVMKNIAIKDLSSSTSFTCKVSREEKRAIEPTRQGEHDNEVIKRF